MSIKFNFKKITDFLKRIPGFLVEKSFLTFLILSILSFLIGGFVFYKYCYSIEKMKPKIIEKQLKIDESKYQEMMNFWDARTKIFEGVDAKEFKNPFK